MTIGRLVGLLVGTITRLIGLACDNAVAKDCIGFQSRAPMPDASIARGTPIVQEPRAGILRTRDSSIDARSKSRHHMAGVIYYASGCLALVVLVFALDIMGLFSRRNHFDVDGRVCSQTTGLRAI
jgi:hypothetical protein